MTPILVALFTLVATVLAGQRSAFCPARCQCNDAELTVSCAEAGLGVVPLTLNPMVKELALPKNNIINIESALGVYVHLEALDVSSNKVNKLASRGLELKQLHRLDLSANLIATVERGAFEGLESLTHLILKKNSITELPSNVFTPLRKLKVLDLSHNKLTVISAGSFHGLTNLERLVLKANALRQVPSEAFIYLPSVRSLDLSANPLSRIDESAFYHLTALEELELERCGIEKLPPDAFVGLANLKHLSVANNKLTNFPQAVSGVLGLEELNIGGNLMKRISVNDLKHLKQLKRLHLTRSKNLQWIDENAFRHTPKLEELWMEFNQQLEHLPTALLNHLGELRKVSLQGNKLQYIHPELLPIGRLESFDVSSNPLVCNCSLAWLWNHMAQNPHQFHNSSDVRCHEPSHLRQNLLRELNDGQLDCRNDPTRGVLAVSLTSAFVFCLLSALLYLTWRKRISDARTGTIIKDLNSSPVNYASYDNHKYPYIIQPYSTFGRMPISAGSTAVLEPCYTTLNPNALQSYLMSLNGARLPVSTTDTNNRAYHTLSCTTQGSGIRTPPSDPGYETIGSEQTYHSLIYV